MRAGDLDRTVALQRQASALDAYGQPVDVWATVGTMRAGVRGEPGREFFAANTVVAERKCIFIIRWRADVHATDRIVHDGAAWNIVSTREIGRRVGLELMATRVT